MLTLAAIAAVRHFAKKYIHEDLFVMLDAILSVVKQEVKEYFGK